MVEKINREEGEKWVIKQGEGIFIFSSLSPPYGSVNIRQYLLSLRRIIVLV